MGHCLMMRKGEVHTAPVTGVLASSLAVGSTVKLMEGGTAVEYLVVNQGIPSNSSLYDASCNGTWLLRKDCHSNRQWHTSDVNKYETSTINTWLNGDFFNSLGSTEKIAVKQVKVPYCPGNKSSTVRSGANGLSVKAFLLGVYEVGWTTSIRSNMPIDGANCSFFHEGNEIDSDRIAYLNGTAVTWYLRSPNTTFNTNAWSVTGNSGGPNLAAVSNDFYIRPTLILPSNALFDETTMLLKGVK